MVTRFVRCDSAVHFTELLPAPSAGHSVALLCIHALGTSHRLYDGLIEALGWRGPVLRYDLRGHGLSEIGEQPCTIASLARDASQLLERLGQRTAVVCGTSVGGLIAQQLALSDARVRAAVLCGTAARIGTLEGWRARIEQVRAGGVASTWELVERRWFTPAFRASQPDLVRGYRCLLERTPEAGYLALLQALSEADLTERVRDIRVPVLVVSGELDEATTPADGEQLASLIPAARFAQLAGASHLMSVEQPGQLARLIDGFTRGLGLG
ncbi:MAG TPA: alpha/beta fold hydrolase [Polyangiaceae bacterium]|nr:alpha/beta fold hydrolase [Polyangiaceae bacterium]